MKNGEVSPPLRRNLAELVWRLFGGHWRDDRNGLAVALGLAEGDGAGDGCEDRVIPAEAHTLSGMHHRAALADDDVAGDDGFAAEVLDAETAARRIAAVAG